MCQFCSTQSILKLKNNYTRNFQVQNVCAAAAALEFERNEIVKCELHKIEEGKRKWSETSTSCTQHESAWQYLNSSAHIQRLFLRSFFSSLFLSTAERVAQLRPRMTMKSRIKSNVCTQINARIKATPRYIERIMCVQHSMWSHAERNTRNDFTESFETNSSSQQGNTFQHTQNNERKERKLNSEGVRPKICIQREKKNS